MVDGVSAPFFPADADLASADFWTTFARNILEGTDQSCAAIAKTILESLHFFHKGTTTTAPLLYRYPQNDLISMALINQRTQNITSKKNSPSAKPVNLPTVAKL